MKTVLLCILDGVGMRSVTHGNAVSKANMPVYKNLFNEYNYSLLDASGEEVGLPIGQMGNSEVGHMNIGAGRVVYQPLQLIIEQIKNKKFFQNEEILNIINHTKENNSNLHIYGLLSDGGVHSSMIHLFALLDMVKKQKVTNLYLHLCTDGRDTPPDSAIKYLKELNDKLNEIGIGKIATISGRYYAMDRDNRWDRVEKAYNAIINGIGEEYNSFEEQIKANYERDITDEFIIPAVYDKAGTIKENDGIIVFNYRPDRLRELWSAVTNKKFKEFKTTKWSNIKLLTFMPVSNDVICKNAFHIDHLYNTLGQYINSKGLKQLRISETEKYAHVTYFLDGGVEKDLEGCKRILIPSPKVATYDLKPEMSMFEITDTLLEELNNNYDLIVLNYANGDMLGHTGNIPATVKALEDLDICLNKVINKVKEINGIMLLTADHGNCEYMLDDDNNVITSHTTSKVPFIVLDKTINVRNGKLADIAPTILELLNIEKPKEMTGDSLLK